ASGSLHQREPKARRLTGNMDRRSDRRWYICSMRALTALIAALVLARSAAAQKPGSFPIRGRRLNQSTPMFMEMDQNPTLHRCGKGFSESSYADLQLYTHGWAGEGKKMCEECLEKC